MKKLIITSLALVAGITLGYSQGAINIASTSAGYLISTNGSAGGLGTGPAGTGANTYYYTVFGCYVWWRCAQHDTFSLDHCNLDLHWRHRSEQRSHQGRC
jgi:hypothetical protein